MDVIVNVAEKSTEQFIQFFYPNYDKQRQQNLGSLYRDNSAILWNGKQRQLSKSKALTKALGNAFSGAQQYSEFLGRLPMSHHEIDVYDCHPLPNTMNAQGTCGILINTSGTVKYGDNPSKRTFSQCFILMPDEKQAGNYYVQSDTFRFV
ncbi:hypothetical protein EDC96DRAFT_570606 [Choanephora cucurbitarum]|nr:hypothetical protein EDC96DRAFT_570606 [Choanephora cucurbitarum]